MKESKQHHQNEILKPLASKKARLFSLVIDFLLFNNFMSLVIILMWFMLGPLESIIQLIEVIGRSTYIIFFIFFYLNKGLSPANKLLGFEIIRTNGQSSNIKEKLIRMGLAGLAPFSFILIIFDQRNRGLHDLITHSEVLQGKASHRKLTVVFVLLVLFYFVPYLF